MTQNFGPGPVEHSEAASSASPVGASAGRSFGARGYGRPLAGLGTVVAIVAIIAVTIGLFQGSFTKTVPVTVVSERAGLVMNPDAKVEMHGVQVGKVDSIEHRSDGTSALHLAMNPSELDRIPSNVVVDIASSTVFGAKSVMFKPPENPSGKNMYAGQVLQGDHVVVEINTVFQQLVSVLDKVNPAKLNETLGAISSAFNGRGEKLGQTMEDFNALLAKLDPSLPNLEHDIETAPEVFDAYADAAPDLLSTIDDTTQISQSIVDEQQNLDAFLVSSIGLADVGNEVIGGNRQALTDVVKYLVPTTDLLRRHHETLYCGIAGLVPLVEAPPLPVPGLLISASLTLGIERYRYPEDLPKVNVTGGPYCEELGLPVVPPGHVPPYILGDTGANPYKYGNQGILLNSDALKQFLFGPLDGPPRNTGQVGMPG